MPATGACGSKPDGLGNSLKCRKQILTMKTNQPGRRKFLQYSTAGIAIAATSGVATGAGLTEVPQASSGKVESLSTDADVLVVGGGTAGTIAAIQSAWAGAKTVLIERGSQLGGTTTVGGVAFPGLFHAWGKQIISGIGWDLVRKAVGLDGGTMPDFTKIPSRHWHQQVHVNQFVYALLAEEECLKAGVTLAYYEFPLSIEPAPHGWNVETVGPGTRRMIKCRQLVDCTGGASVVGMLGMPRLRESEIQPGSFLYRFGGEHKPGRAQLDRLYVHGADSSTSATLTEANLKGRQALLKKLRVHERQQPRDGEKARLMHMQPETAFRESYRIVGETVITHDDYVSGLVFEDAICNAFYPVDLHTRSGVKPKPLEKGIVPTVPLRALIPKNSRNILVAGRCVSSDRLANSGLRVQAPCMAMGQAAGAAAALAARNKRSPLEVPLAAIRDLLGKHGAILPPAAKSQ